jgi:hypothetical protein
MINSSEQAAFVRVNHLVGLRLHLQRWPPRSPDLTPCDSFYGDMWKTLPTNQHPPPPQDRINAAMQTTDEHKLQRVWQELGYRIDVCRVTKGAHIEHLWVNFAMTIGNWTWTATVYTRMCVKLHLIFDSLWIQCKELKSFRSFWNTVYMINKK